MGFFANLGEKLFGTKTKKQGQELAAAGGASAATAGRAAATAGRAAATAGTAAATAGAAAGAVGTAAEQQGAAAGQQAQFYDTAARKSMGGSATEYMQNANKAAQGQAEQAGTAAATAGTQAALRAARSSGLSKGQAALASGQQAGDIYTGTYQKGLESGRDQYQQATGQLAGQGAQMAGRQQSALNTQLGAAGTQVGAAGTQVGAAGTQVSAAGTQVSAAGTQAGIGAQQQQAAAQTAQNTWGTIGTIAGALVSDENCKENIEELDYDKANSILDGVNIDEIAQKIRPVKYNYKEGVGTPGEKLGVIAQDLEETPLESMVKEDENGTKMIDTNELTGANLNLIIQLARKVADLEDQLKGVR